MPPAEIGIESEPSGIPLRPAHPGDEDTLEFPAASVVLPAPVARRVARPRRMNTPAKDAEIVTNWLRNELEAVQASWSGSGNLQNALEAAVRLQDWVAQVSRYPRADDEG